MVNAVATAAPPTAEKAVPKNRQDVVPTVLTAPSVVLEKVAVTVGLARFSVL
jgi:hypothetical protein